MYSSKALLCTVVLALIFAAATVSFSFAQTLSGTFVGADAGHEASGSFRLTEEGGERVLEFSEDFMATRGPDLFVWLVSGDDTSNVVSLGRLQSASGVQRYTVPEDVELADFDRVIVWCRLFRFLFATAEFRQNP